MALAAGSSVGPYHVVAPLGAGGMGEVYRARDPRLGRDVAIKVLPESLAHDSERLARFEREARTLAALSHAGIAALYGVEPLGSSRALVMELVEGPTLADRLAAGALAEDEALAVARQLAEAIEYAHEHGIVHRDLKPANIKLRPDGTVKVLDFGLARALDADTSAGDGQLSQSPTLTHRMTTAGVLLGTAAYMAPEQARGRPADRRADIFAFGAVLFEMLTGRRAFGGETISDTLAAVMRDMPDLGSLPPGISPGWRRLLERCLEKDAKKRLQAIGEARIALADLDAFAGGAAVAAPARRVSALRTALPWALAAALAVVVLVLMQRRPAAGPAASELSIVPAGGQRIAEDAGYLPLAITPDARTIAYTVREGGELRLRLRRLDRREDVELVGFAGARNLFFSRDGDWLGFFDTRKMSKVSVRGGAPVELADALQDRLGAWLDDGTIVYSRNTTEPLYRVSEKGGTPVAITRLDSTRRERTHRFPSALDGGPWVVFTAQTVDSPGGYDDADIVAVSVKTGERRHLYKGARRAAWAPGGHLILARGNDLYAVPIDPRNPRVTRDPVPVLRGVAGEASSGASYFAIADDGTIAWIPHGEPDDVREVGWFDRAGRWTATPLPPGAYGQLVIAPDGERALVSVGPGGGSQDLWLADLRNGGMNRLTHGGRSGYGAWFPDGLRIACSARDSVAERIVVRRLDGAGGTRDLARAGHPLIVSDVTPDGQEVLYCDYGLKDGRQYLVRASGDAPPRTLPADGDGYELGGRVSPDGRWIAYISNKTRREEVCIRSLGGGGGNWQISQRGSGVRWGREGRELFFVSNESLHRASITVHGDEVRVGQPEPMFEVPPTSTEAAFRDYDYDPVHDRFLFTRPPRGAADRREIAVSLGWSKRLRQMLAAAGR